MKFPVILVLNEKHGDYYYLMNNAEDVTDFAIKLLKERFDLGCYYIEPKPVPETFDGFFMAVHNMSLAAAENLASNFDDTVNIGNRSARNEIDSMKTAYGYALAEVTEYDKIKKAVDESDGKLAWKILYARSSWGAKYEGFSIEQIENLKKKDDGK